MVGLLLVHDMDDLLDHRRRLEYFSELLSVARLVRVARFVAFADLPFVLVYY